MSDVRGERLRTLVKGLLEREGITQAELARRIGHSEKHVSQALTGVIRMSLPLADRMLAAMGWELQLAVAPLEVSE